VTKPRLLFVSPRYLLPADMGGKIRTAHVLKGLKGGRFHVTLLSPAPDEIPAGHALELQSLCDDFRSWREPSRGPLFAYTRLRHLASSLPVPVATDRSETARQCVADALQNTDVVVADFLHAVVLLPARIPVASVLFTHNVEAEIFARHAEIAPGPLRRAIWRNQLGKMQRFERTSLSRFDSVVAVSDRDRDFFRREYGTAASTIPTGVDLEYFAFHPVRETADPPVIAFTASMDSLANIDGVRWLMDAVWPLIVREQPGAQMRVIGRNPDAGLVNEAKRRGLNWIFTGYVDDVRPHLEDANVYVIPLRVGGGTRIKAYEAMAFGLPTVSTAVGIEGLAVEPEKHFLQADNEADFAGAVLKLSHDAVLRRRLAEKARAEVEQNFSARSVGAVFESICVAAMDARDAQSRTSSSSAIPARTRAPGTSGA
jgi:glycosyltransferase involved in cell wall biosynthesis